MLIVEKSLDRDPLRSSSRWGLGHDHVHSAVNALLYVLRSFQHRRYVPELLCIRLHVRCHALALPVCSLDIARNLVGLSTSPTASGSVTGILRPFAGSFLVPSCSRCTLFKQLPDRLLVLALASLQSISRTGKSGGNFSIHSEACIRARRPIGVDNFEQIISRTCQSEASYLA